jgi:SAM-dependent methyltransferase
VQVTPKLVAVDISPRMVGLARARGVEAVVGDVCALPFEPRSFDCAVANWMLYHASDIEAALTELARVLRAGGRLVATTNSTRHLEELWALVGRDVSGEPRRFSFSAEDGGQLLRRHFARVSRRDVVGRISFDADGARRYIGSSVLHEHLVDRVPELPEPLVATRRCTVFVAETAS